METIKVFTALAAVVLLSQWSVLAKAAGEITNPQAIGGPHECSARWYPRSAVQHGVEGYVGVSFDIETDGAVTNVAVVQSSGSLELDGAAEACVSKFRYQPAKRDGSAIKVPWVTVVIFCISRECWSGASETAQAIIKAHAVDIHDLKSPAS